MLAIKTENVRCYAAIFCIAVYCLTSLAGCIGADVRPMPAQRPPAKKIVVRSKPVEPPPAKKIVVRSKPVEPPSAIRESVKCASLSLKTVKTLFLGNGDAWSLFERYLGQNNGIEDKLPYDLKVKFYEKQNNGNGNNALQTAQLGDIESVFVESPKDFLHRMQKQLKGRKAESLDEINGVDSGENVDYFQCP